MQSFMDCQMMSFLKTYIKLYNENGGSTVGSISLISIVQPVFGACLISGMLAPSMAPASGCWKSCDSSPVFSTVMVVKLLCNGFNALSGIAYFTVEAVVFVVLVCHVGVEYL